MDIDRVYDVNGVPMILDLTDGIQNTMALGIYELAQSDWLKQNLAPGATFVDVGANFGWYTTLAYSLVGSDGLVFSFEPSPVAFSVLCRSMSGPEYRNVTLVNAAVGQQAGYVTLHLPDGGPLHSPSLFEAPGVFNPVRVPMITLDSFEPFSSLPMIDFMKIDVEGSEPDVLEGMAKMAAAGRIRRVMCEFNSWWLNANNCTIESLDARFKSLGFVQEASTERGTHPAGGGGTFDLQDILYKHVG